MSGIELAATIIFVVGYVFITFEHQIGLQKAPMSLVMAGLLWWLVSRQDIDFAHDMEEAGWEITQIVFFLLFAMTLVELISRLGFFELVRVRLQERNWNDTRQFVVLMALTFCFSAVLDNLTTAIVMTEICRRFFRGRNLLAAAAGVVVLANAGGAWSPIGDVTTIMLWLAGKFTTEEIITQAFFPSLAHGVVATVLLARVIRDEPNDDSVENLPLTFSPASRVMMTVALLCFTLPFIATQMDLAPFIGLGFGFGVVGVLYNQLGSAVQSPHGMVAGEPVHAHPAGTGHRGGDQGGRFLVAHLLRRDPAQRRRAGRDGRTRPALRHLVRGQPERRPDRGGQRADGMGLGDHQQRAADRGRDRHRAHRRSPTLVAAGLLCGDGWLAPDRRERGGRGRDGQDQGLTSLAYARIASIRCSSPT